MAIQFKNIQHALASFFTAVVNDAKQVEKALPKIEAGIETVEGSKTIVEEVSSIAANAFAPGSAPLVKLIEEAAFAGLAALDNALKAGGAAAEKKLLDAGLDQVAIDAAKAVGRQSVGVYTLVKAAASK